MKHIIFGFLLLLSSTCCLAQLNYEKGNWDSWRRTAAAQKKLIFLDAYTDWCGWCKVMDKETFTDPEVKAFISAHFIAIKIEMEKEEIGQKLSMKYLINAFPSFAVFNSDGVLVYLSEGYQKPRDFMKTLKSMTDPAMQKPAMGYNHSKLDMDYPAFYKEAYAGNGKRKFPSDTLLNAYLDKQTDMLNEININVMMRFSYLLNDKYAGHLYATHRHLGELYGKDRVDKALWTLIYAKMEVAAKKRNRQGLDILFKKYEEMFSETPEHMFRIRINYFGITKEWGEFVASVDGAISQGVDMGPEYINSQAWAVYENSNDSSLNRRASEWMKPVIQKSWTYAYLDTYAAVLYKGAKLNEAEFYALKAIEVGKENHEKIEETEKLLLKIRTAKGAAK